ncbi:MAG: cytochrome c biogenesis protein ResB, partial [Thermodesulfobacteria bacterium]|nr:cytochrome c biogenesis protein ResB [Thermodesulfobacteriota bacterium]
TDLTSLKESIVKVFSELAGKPRSKHGVDGGDLYFVEKGRWSYWGVYLIHTSILVIFAGAILGTFTGFKGRVMLLEGESTDHAIQMDSHGNIKKIPLGFVLKCDKFKVDFYPNGAPKLFRSDLTVFENGREKLRKSIVVNSPLTYKGITFYQSTYQAVPELRIRIVSSDGEQKVIDLSAFDKGLWPEKNLLLGIIKYLPNVHGAPAARVFVGNPSGNDGDAVWLLQGHDREVTLGKNTFRLSLVSAKEKFMTGLQVKKDPGVWIVWLGCALMVIGFGIVFWVGHKRLWLWIGQNGEKLSVILAGQTNKNKVAFEKEFEKIKREIDKRIGEQ